MDEEGVSPIIGTILILAILTVVTSTLLTVVWPQIQDTRDRGDFQTVSGQLSRVAGDLTHMAVGGNVGEIRQRTVVTSQGQLAHEHGHLWGLSIALADEDYSEVQGSGNEYARGEHPQFNVTDHDGAEGASFTVGYRDESVTSNTLYWTLCRFNGSGWTDCADDNSGSLSPPDSFPVTLTTGTLRDGPWSLWVYDDSARTDLIGLVYVYELDRIAYRTEGALMPRGVFIENAAVFLREDTAYFSTAPGLYRTATTGGSVGLNLRIAQLSDPTMGTTSGQAKTAFQMSLLSQDHFAHNLGAIQARLQPLDGPLIEGWATHLSGDGFDPTTSEPGVAFSYSPSDPDMLQPFPASVIYSDIKLRMVST